jgi:cell division protein DivIC
LNPRRLLLACFVVLLAGLTVLVAVFFYQTRQEYVRLRAMNADINRQLVDAQMRLEQQETILRRLKTDPAYVERVIRSKLGYAKPDEQIFRAQE